MNMFAQPQTLQTSYITLHILSFSQHTAFYQTKGLWKFIATTAPIFILLAIFRTNARSRNPACEATMDYWDTYGMQSLCVL